MLNKSLFLLTMMVALLFWNGSILHAGQEDKLAVIINKDNPKVNISRSELQRIYKKTKQVWKHGGLIVPIDLDGKVFKEFYNTTFKGEKFEVDIYWMKQIFTRSLKPPIKKKSSDSVKRFVKSNKNSIGYIPMSELDDSVKQLAVLK